MNSGLLAGCGTTPIPRVEVFSSSGTFRVDGNATFILVELWGGGGGGASGRRGASLSIRGGGAGGNSGAYARRVFRPSELTSTVSVTIGAGGTGGTGRTSDNSNGVGGGSGAISTFGLYLKTTPFSSAAVGSNASATSVNGADTATVGVCYSECGYGGMSNAQDGVSSIAGMPIDSGYCGGGGGSGGGVDVSDVFWAGTNGGFGNPAGANVTGGAGGATSGANGSNGTAGVNSGGGGGGGGAGNAGVGGNGATFGGGGGGGGGSLNGTTSGAGGNGANGGAVITTFYE